ncbi:hypothetical protein LI90_1843 [Carbonactinospora thermoautotrophica]|uniref:Copper transporter n=1 Tax=Carbonactinospora thermoautotrophica TaxID=1469144 RepID=A0A132MSU7_9ACTN|nr:copper transporter [Carbonactinospora thermoautotrophica]KWX00816.1 hypothetical protein LI90_1843 [Carbonactinospora thermoautotrophica]
MIDFRYHVVSIIAIFLALTVGIVLGSSVFNQPLVERLNTEAKSLQTEAESLRSQIRQLQRDVQYRDQFADRAAPTLVADRLRGESVVVVALPGAEAQVVDSLVEMLRQAGASVPGRVAVKESFTDRTKAEALDALVASVAPPGLKLPGNTPQARAATELAYAITTTQKTELGVPTGPRTRILTAFREAGFIDVRDNPGNLGTLAVVVAPPAPGDAVDQSQAKQAHSAYLALVAALDTHSRGVVLAGPEEAADVGGLIKEMREDGRLAARASSVDVADTATGRVSVVFALVAEMKGKSGQYGVHGTTDGPLSDVLGQTTQ